VTAFYFVLCDRIYFVTGGSDIAVFVRLRVCMSQCIRTLPGLDQLRN